jgi:hypothetical protein
MPGSRRVGSSSKVQTPAAARGRRRFAVSMEAEEGAMPKVLTQAQIETYQRVGCLSPVRAMSAERARHYRERFEALEARVPDIKKMKTKSHLLCPWVLEIAEDPHILDIFEDLVGPDLRCWSMAWRVKKPTARPSPAGTRTRLTAPPRRSSSAPSRSPSAARARAACAAFRAPIAGAFSSTRRATIRAASWPAASSSPMASTSRRPSTSRSSRVRW